MRIATLDPALTEIVAWLGLDAALAGISHDSDFPAELGALPKVTTNSAAGGPDLQLTAAPHLPGLRELRPDVVLARVRPEAAEGADKAAGAALSAALGPACKVFVFAPATLESLYGCYERIGEVLGRKAEGVKLAGRIKAQMMDWSANFYERMRHKRVTFVCALDPLEIAGLWIPDLVHLTSAVSQHRFGGEPHEESSWQAVNEFRPDVLIVAPEGMKLDESARTFKQLEKVPQWEEILAVKRGQVFFCDGHPHFYRPGPRLLDSMAILVSAVAGLDSGYITPRDSFYRLRWLEMQRHRF